MDEITWALVSLWEWWKCKNAEYDNLQSINKLIVGFTIGALLFLILVNSFWCGVFLIASFLIGRGTYEYSILSKNYNGHHDCKCGGTCKTVTDIKKEDINNIGG